MHKYTPANVPGLPAGWEIDFYESGDYFNLSLWRVRGFLHPYKEDREDPLVYSCSRYADAYLPVGYSDEDFNDAMQELIWKSTQFDAMIDEYEELSDIYPKATNRPSRYDYFNKIRRRY